MAADNRQALPSLDVWTSALLAKSTAGRGGSGKLEAYGIKKLRELILELAVRGKLVAQDPNDEPASALLKKIEKEKARLIEEGMIAAQKSLPEVTKAEEYFNLPNGWAWSRLGEITNYGITDKAEPDDVSKDTWILDLEDVEKETSKLLKKYRFAEKPFLSSKNRFASGDVIYGKLRPYLDKVLVADEDGVCTTEMMPVRGYFGIAPFYLRLLMKAPHFIKYADDSTHGMNLPRLGTDKARMALFPLAPLAEQHRIVAKVDELMALCDQLEQQQTHSLAAHQTLVETLLDTLTRTGSQQEFSAAWARIASHFDTLFTTEASIAQLKQTLLQLAVMGKLVPQDPNDEPASVLLKRIQVEKAKLIAEGKVKKDKPPQAIAEDEKPFVLPQSWEWICLSDLMPEFQNGVSSRGDKDGNPTTVLRLADIKNRRISLEDTRTIPINPRDIEKYQLLMGDILITRVNGSADIVGNFILNDGGVEAIYCDHFIRMRIAPQWINANYLCLLGESSLVRNKIQNLFITTAGQKTVNQGHIGSLPIALPPFAEQRRIVAKVDELMALCDTLKARIKDAQTTQLHLADAIVEQAVC